MIRLRKSEAEHWSRTIGVNLNQIARALNSGASAPAGMPEAAERVGELAGSSTSMHGAKEWSMPGTVIRRSI